MIRAACRDDMDFEPICRSSLLFAAVFPIANMHQEGTFRVVMFMGGAFEANRNPKALPGAFFTCRGRRAAYPWG